MPKLIDIAFTNPTRTLNKAIPSIYVGMEHLEPHQRFIQKWGVRRFPGSGSRFKNGDTLLARITPCLENGKTAYVDFLSNHEEVAHGSTEFIILSARPDKCDELFLYYLARSEFFRAYAIKNMLGTSGRQRVRAEALDEFDIPVIPSINEQRELAKSLGAFDSKIQSNQETCILAETTLRKLWVDLTSKAGTTHVRLGEDLVDFNPNTPLSRIEPSAYVDMRNVPTHGSIIRGFIPRVFKGGAKFRNGDTIVARITPCFENGKAAFVDCLKDGEVGWGSTEFIILRAKIGIPNFAPYCIVRDPLFKEYGVRQMTGTSGRQRISATSLSEYMTPIPSTHDLEYFDKKSNELTSLIARLGKENVILAKLRDRLIYKAISASTQLDSVNIAQVDSFLNIDTSNMQTSGALFK